MENILNDFDWDKSAILEPWMTIKKLDNFPEIGVATFSGKLMESLKEWDNTEQIGEITTANGASPIYKIIYEGQPVAAFKALVGAPACVAAFEEVMAMGLNKLILFGSCGVLNHKIADGHIVIPTSAVRDEGTSYHYLPASDEIKLEGECIEVVEGVLKKLNYPYVLGKTWTTDGVYRETKVKVEKRKKQGCICVEMECSAMAAVAKFRNVKFAQFLYAADNLDSPNWQPRGFGKHSLSQKEKLLAAALECGINL